MQNFLPSINPNDQVEIVINTDKPIEAIDFVTSIKGFSGAFQIYANDKNNTEYKIPNKIYIQEIRKGSFVINFVMSSLPTVREFLESGMASCFVELLKYGIGKILDKKKPENKVEKNLYKCIDDIVQPVLKDTNSFINIQPLYNNCTFNNIKITFSDAEKMHKVIDEFQNDEEKKLIYKQVPMTWIQANFQNKASGNRGLIEAIDTKPLKVYFNPPDLQHAIMRPHAGFNIAWQDLIFVVDVEVIQVEGVNRYYKVFNWYPDLIESKI